METLGFILLVIVCCGGGFAGGFFYCYHISEAYYQSLKTDTEKAKYVNQSNAVYIKLLESDLEKYNEHFEKEIKGRV